MSIKKSRASISVSFSYSTNYVELLERAANLMIINALNGNDYRSGVLEHMEQFNNVAFGGILLVEPYYNLCCHQYAVGGSRALFNITQGELPLEFAPIYAMKHIDILLERRKWKEHSF